MSELTNYQLEEPSYRSRTAGLLLVLFGLAFLILLGRLFYLQVVKGDYHEKLSFQNAMRLQVLHAPRGLILDRTGQIIAGNRPSIQIALVPTQIKEPERLLRNLLRFTDSTGARIFDSALIAWSLERGKWRKFQPLVIYEDASPELVAMVEEHQLDLPAVVTLKESRRYYPFRHSAAHALGYMDEVKEQELENFRKRGDSLLYGRGDRIGRKGLEKHYEGLFRGQDGIRYVKVNAYGKEVEVLRDMPQIPPTPGRTLVTSIDMDLQNFTDSILGDSVKGAVVAVDPRNGEVLVMASSPRMDGNIFSLSKEKRSKEWAKLALDSNRPLNNRATVGGYEPGSTFKGVVSIASFHSGRHRPQDHMPRGCGGGYRFGNRTWRCWEPKGHGSMNFYDAFAQSCDVYYYQIGLDIGIHAINEAAEVFGFGKKTGIDLDEERSGELISPESYNKRFRKIGWVWTRGLILNLSIGQGQISTPLQLANYAAGLGNGKRIYRPHFIREVRRPDGTVDSIYRPEVLHELNLSPEEHAHVLKAMEKVVNEPMGTGGRARVPNVVVGGKTGSSENPHGGKTHALFIGVAPLHAPEIAIGVVLENIGHGGSFAAPIAGAVFKRYFARKAGGTGAQGG